MTAINLRVVGLSRLTGSENCDTSCASCMSCSDGGGGAGIDGSRVGAHRDPAATHLERAEANLRSAIERRRSTR